LGIEDPMDYIGINRICNDVHNKDASGKQVILNFEDSKTMSQPQPLWLPSQSFREHSNLHQYMQWLAAKGKTFTTYLELHAWSVANMAEFWEGLLSYFNVSYSSEYQHVVQGKMPRTQWFEGVALSYAEHIFRNAHDQYPALIFTNEAGEKRELSWKALIQKVASLQQFLLKAGVQKGDRVAAYLPNIPEATISFLATNSVGAVWSSCSPDFGTQAVLDRFVQIEPTVLIVTDGYEYGGKFFSREMEVNQLIQALSTVKEVIVIPSKNPSKNFPRNFTSWNKIPTTSQPITFTRVPFSHPIWILYSSGTTGMPKAITHGTGGILMEQLKYGAFHQDVKKGERCFWYTTTGWMMWNYLHGCLLAGGTMVLYDGHPAYPDRNALWKLIDECQIAHFGISGSYIVSMMKSDIEPQTEFKLDSLRSIGSTGSPLPAEGFRWIYDKVKQNVWLTSMSGGTDVCSAFVGGCPLLPVYASEIQCFALGCDLQVWDENGRPTTDEGEMMITQPMPSMPVFFWNDPEFKRYSESYFDLFPNAWRHGDWIRETEHGGLIIYGRSDATLNRGGVRIGSAEIYKVMDKVTEVKDSLIVCIDKPGGEFYMPLFVMLSDGAKLSESLTKKIKHQLKVECSPRHVPDDVIVCPDIPYTLSGKKTETPVKKILMGRDPEKVVNAGSLRNPASLKFFIEFFQSHNS
jgi:acetoacetyl-CoA synthetase